MFLFHFIFPQVTLLQLSYCMFLGKLIGNPYKISRSLFFHKGYLQQILSTKCSLITFFIHVRSKELFSFSIIKAIFANV